MLRYDMARVGLVSHSMPSKEASCVLTLQSLSDLLPRCNEKSRTIESTPSK